MWELLIPLFLNIGSILITEGIKGFAGQLGSEGGTETAKGIKAGFSRCFDKIKLKLSNNDEAKKVLEDFEIEPENVNNNKQLVIILNELLKNESGLVADIEDLVNQAKKSGLKMNIDLKIYGVKTAKVFEGGQMQSGEYNTKVEVKDTEDFTFAKDVNFGRQ